MTDTRKLLLKAADIAALEVRISLIWVSLYFLIAVFMASFGPLLYRLHRSVVL